MHTDNTSIQTPHPEVAPPPVVVQVASPAEILEKETTEFLKEHPEFEPTLRLALDNLTWALDSKNHILIRAKTGILARQLADIKTQLEEAQLAQLEKEASEPLLSLDEYRKETGRLMNLVFTHISPETGSELLRYRMALINTFKTKPINLNEVQHNLTQLKTFMRRNGLLSENASAEQLPSHQLPKAKK